MRLEDITVEVRNPALARVGQLTGPDFSSALITPRSNNVGSWSVQLPDKVRLADGTDAENEIAFLLRQPGYGIIVTGPNGVILSGPTTGASHVASTNDPGGTWTIVGVSDAVILGHSEAWPDPGHADPAAADRPNDVRTAPAETLLHQFVSNNLGPLAVPARRNPLLVMGSNAGLGPVLTESPRYKNLLNVLQEIVTGTSLQFDVLQAGSQLRFTTWLAADRTDDVRLDMENNQLTSEQTEYSAPTATEVKVLGQGEGVDRQVITRTSTASLAAAALWHVRIERTLDQRQTDDVAELAQAGDDLLSEEGSTVYSFRVVPSGDLAETFEDGDFITIVINNRETTAQVTERPISISSEGVFVGATIGDPTGFDWESLVNRRQDSADRRISAIERNVETAVITATERSNVRLGSVIGIDSNGVQVVLDDGFGTVTATTRNPRYFPFVGDRVATEQSGVNIIISHLAKPAKAVRADIPLQPTWTRYDAETYAWNAGPAGPFAKPQVYRTTNGTVKVTGLLRKYSGTFVSGEKCAILPPGFRPEYPIIVASQGSTGGSIVGRGQMVVDVDGSIYPINVPADGQFVSLECITFPLGLTWTNITPINTFTVQPSFGPVGGMPLMTIPPLSAALDSNGITWTRGGVSRTADPANGTVIFAYPNGMGIKDQGQAHIATAGHTVSSFGYTVVGAAGTVNRNRSWYTPGSRGVFFDGGPFVSESSSLVAYGTVPAYPNPIQPFGTGTYSGTAAWSPRAYLTPEGMVYLYGLPNSAAAGVIGVMHPELKPNYRSLYPTISGGGAGRVDINVNGVVVFSAGATWQDLSSISYMADPQLDLTYGGL